jgi:hypothetical protein
MESILEKYEENLRVFIRFIYSWLSTDGEVLGYILGVCHFVISVTISVMVVVSHTLYPVLWFQILVFVLLLVIWIQHVFFKVCISIVAEQKLTNNEPPFFQIIRDILHIQPTEFINYFLVAETVWVGCFSLELLAKLSVYLYDYYDLVLQ